MEGVGSEHERLRTLCGRGTQGASSLPIERPCGPTSPLAGLPPEVGLYASTVPLVLYALLGTSRQLTVLGRLPGTSTYRDLERFPTAERIPGLVIVRFDVSLSYLNVEFMKRRVHRLVADAPEPVRAVVLDGSGVNDIDTSATEALTEFIDELADRDVVVHLASVKGPVRDVLLRDGLYQSLGDRVHDHVDDAVRALRRTTER